MSPAWTCFCMAVSCILSWIFMFTLFVITLPLWLVVVSYKYLVNAVVRFIHPDWTPMTGTDISCLGTIRNHEEGRKLWTNIGLTFVVEEDLDLRAFQEEFRKRILEVKSRGSSNCDEFLFHRLMEQPLKFMGHFYFSRASPPTDLNPLIYELKRTETENVNFIIDWCTQSYKKGQPLWEVLLLKIEKEKGKTFVCFKMSHGLGDMVSITTIMSHLLGVDFAIATQETYSRQKQSRWISFSQSLKLLAMGPYLFLSTVRNFLSQPDIVSRTPKHKDWVATVFAVELDPLKEIRRAYGCRFTDVTLALLASSLRRFLLESIKEENLPSTIAFASPRVMPHSRTTICNQVTQMLVNLPILHPSNKQRLLQLSKESHAVLKSGIPTLFNYFSFLPYLIPSIFLEYQDLPHTGISCGYSGIPIGEKKLLFGKHAVSSVYPISSMNLTQIAIQGIGLSYGQDVFFGIVGNTGLFKDIDAIKRIETYFLQEMESLYKTTFEVA